MYTWTYKTVKTLPESSLGFISQELIMEDWLELCLWLKPESGELQPDSNNFDF